ncbi:MAG: PHP domain-containing protein [Clostridia bacterium]|nr:PHP domain-containing protein [Clostridia bacterium]
MEYSFDLHMHSCLSPCGSNENTPALLAGLSAVNETDIIALTDHNTCKNCGVFMEAAEHYGLLGIPGMELTTSEEVHVVCLFPDLNSAMEFDGYVHSRLMQVKNKPKFFGQQLVVDIDDNVVCEEEIMLAGASDIGIYEVYDLVDKLGGVSYPAHIDRPSNSLLSNLGFWDASMKFPMAELSYGCDFNTLKDRKDLQGLSFVRGSDAHYPDQLKPKFQCIDLAEKTAAELINKLNNNIL